MSDEKTDILIKSALKGDMQSFEELIYQYEKKVYNVALRVFKNPEDAKDISQDVFIKIYKNLDKFDNKSSFSTWIYRITTNTCIDELRKRKGKETVSIDNDIEDDEGRFKREFADNEPTPEEKVISKEGESEIIKSMNTLSDEHRTIIVMRDIEGLSYTEISEIIGVSIGTVKSRISRARLQLKNIILKREQKDFKVVNINERRVK
mgnify:CR=1 FL=1